MLQTNALVIIKIQILSSVTLSFENRAVYEIIWKHIVEADRPQMTVWRMRIAYCITKATNTKAEYVARNLFSTATVAARTRFTVTL